MNSCIHHRCTSSSLLDMYKEAFDIDASYNFESIGTGGTPPLKLLSQVLYFSILGRSLIKVSVEINAASHWPFRRAHNDIARI